MTEKLDMYLYNGDEVITFYPTTHWYKKGKDFLTSVTAITSVVDKSDALVYRATNLARDYLLENVNNIDEDCIRTACLLHKTKKEEAASIGSLVHDWIERYTADQSVELPEDEQVKNGIMAFLKWKNDNDVKFLKSEAIVYSKKYDYVGKMDALVEIGGKKYFVDYKTSNGFYPMEMGMQVAAYRAAYLEESNYPIQEGEEGRVDDIAGNIIIRIGKDTGEFEVKYLDDYANDIECFRACIPVAKRKKYFDKIAKEERKAKKELE